jgi:hypothetical protein
MAQAESTRSNLRVSRRALRNTVYLLCGVLGAVTALTLLLDSEPAGAQDLGGLTEAISPVTETVSTATDPITGSTDQNNAPTTPVAEPVTETVAPVAEPVTFG